MAASWEVKGKSLILIGDANGNPATPVGQTADDDKITYEEMIHQQEFFSSESGPKVPAKIIHEGRTGTIRAVLTQWDDSVVDSILLAPGASSIGQLGDLGDDVNLFSLKIMPAVSGATGYVFNNCKFEDQVGLTEWGVTVAKRVLIFKAIPDPNSASDTALSTPTTALYTKFQV